MYSNEEIQEHDIHLIWECNKCHHQREDYPGINEGGLCSCGGEYQNVGESYI